MEKFKDLGLNKVTLEILEKKKIVDPTQIQSKAIPLVLKGRDVVAASATGSGKTLVFASAIIERIIPNKTIQAIILTPTRELAEQVTEVMKMFAKQRLEILSIYGGVSIDMQIRKIKNTDVIVGTPGRVLDHLSRGSLQLKGIKILVLDEFDRMLDMGFRKDVDKIISKLPKNRQTLLFSATPSGEEQLVDEYTKNAIEINVETYVDSSKLKQVYYDAPSNMKFSLLVHLLKQKENSGLVLVFCSTRRNVDFIAENLNLNGLVAKAIHGGLDQKKRIRVLKEFHEKNLNILVCTDVAARGLDIKGVSHVYNYDLPRVVEDYIHRIGRTARAGENGIAINILSSRDYPIFSDIVNQKEVKIDGVKMPYIKKVMIDKTFGRNVIKNSRVNSRTPHNNYSKNNRSSSRVTLYDAVCKKCNKKCQVPFKPTNGKGVLCSNCFVRKTPRNSSKRIGDSKRQVSNFGNPKRRNFNKNFGKNRNTRRLTH